MRGSDAVSLGRRLRGDDQLELMLLTKSHDGYTGLWRAWGLSLDAWAWVVDGTVEACGGITQGLDNEHCGWIICSADATKDKKLFCRWAKAALYVMCERYPTIAAHTLVSTGHGEWLEWLGFTPQFEYDVEGFTFRKYLGTFIQE